MTWGSDRLKQKAEKDGVAGSGHGWREESVQSRTKRELAELYLGSVTRGGGSGRFRSVGVRHSVRDMGQRTRSSSTPAVTRS